MGVRLMNILEKIKQDGFDVGLSKPDLIWIGPPEKLTDEYRNFLILHKPEIISCLKAANDEINHRYAYRYEFKHGEGAGVWITDIDPKNAERKLLARFPGKEINLLVLLN